MKKLVLASSNPGKLHEITSIMQPLNIAVLPQSQFAIPDADETGTTFVENALLKARHACIASQLPALADDSGLIIDALEGRPGIYSARYAGKDTPYPEKLQQLLAELHTVPAEQRTARFYCAIALLRFPTDPAPLICVGQWEGHIAFSPQGAHGFGYDPIFYVADYHCTAAELDTAVKNRISHRAQALQQLMEKMRDLSCHLH
jgi:XTP/dITP diphosphohydrolase